MEKERVMAKKPRPWTKEDVRTLKTLVREKTKTSVKAQAYGNGNATKSACAWCETSGSVAAEETWIAPRRSST
jgi:hypothetical protein